MNDTTVRPFHVRTGNSGLIFSWCDDTQKFSPFAVFIMAVEGVCFNFQFQLSISFWIVNLRCFWQSFCDSDLTSARPINLRSAIVEFICCYQLISVSIINFICASNHQKLFSSIRFREVLVLVEKSFNYLSSTNCWFTTVVGTILWMKVWIPTVVIWIILWMKVWIPTVVISDKEEPQTVEREAKMCASRWRPCRRHCSKCCSDRCR